MSTAIAKQWDPRSSHGGELRRRRSGRRKRPLDSKAPHHLVFKVDKRTLRKGLRHPRTFQIVNEVIKKYSRKFDVRIEQCSIQLDHIHLNVRCRSRSKFLSFFRVVAGQISQRVTDTFDRKWEGGSIWKHRPFTRIVKGYRALWRLRDYIQLNELEVTGRLPYRKERTRGMSLLERMELWLV